MVVVFVVVFVVYFVSVSFSLLLLWLLLFSSALFYPSRSPALRKLPKMVCVVYIYSFFIYYYYFILLLFFGGGGGGGWKGDVFPSCFPTVILFISIAVAVFFLCYCY